MQQGHAAGQLKRLWARLKQLSTMQLTRKELLMKLGAAPDQSRSAWRLVVVEVAADSATFSYRLDRNKLRQARAREGRYLLRTTSSRKTRPSCGATICCWLRSRRHSRTSKACPREGGGRPGDPAGVSPARGAHRGPHLHRLPGLLPARHPCAAFACSGAGVDTGYCNAELEKLFIEQSSLTDQEKRRRLVWEIDKKLQEDEARPIIFHARLATCLQPQLKGLTIMGNSQYNGWRMEDVWLDR